MIWITEEVVAVNFVIESLNFINKMSIGTHKIQFMEFHYRWIVMKQIFSACKD